MTTKKKTSASADYSDVISVWHAQHQFAFAKIKQTPGIGNPNSPFNMRVDKRTEEKKSQQPKRQRPRRADGRPYSSTRITAIRGCGATH